MAVVDLSGCNCCRKAQSCLTGADQSLSSRALRMCRLRLSKIQICKIDRISKQTQLCVVH